MLLLKYSIYKLILAILTVAVTDKKSQKERNK